MNLSIRSIHYAFYIRFYHSQIYKLTLYIIHEDRYLIIFKIFFKHSIQYNYKSV